MYHRRSPALQHLPPRSGLTRTLGRLGYAVCAPPHASPRRLGLGTCPLASEAALRTTACSPRHAVRARLGTGRVGSPSICPPTLCRGAGAPRGRSHGVPAGGGPRAPGAQLQLPCFGHSRQRPVRCAPGAGLTLRSTGTRHGRPPCPRCRLGSSSAARARRPAASVPVSSNVRPQKLAPCPHLP